jgi:hypothetical protein
MDGRLIGPDCLKAAVAESPLAVRSRLPAVLTWATLGGELGPELDEAGIAENTLAVADGIAAAFAAPLRTGSGERAPSGSSPRPRDR